MVSAGRHPKKPINKAIENLDKTRFEVEEIHRGHRWGVVRCRTCGANRAIWSTPRVPENNAKDIERFDLPIGTSTRKESVMPTYEFTVTLDRALVDEDYDRIFEAGLDDTTPGTEDGRGVLMVSRDAESLSAALVSIVEDAERAGFRVVGVEGEDLVSLTTIAKRLGRSYESLRLIVHGKRGTGGFPAPLSGDGWALYSWANVSTWFLANYGTGQPVTDDERLIAAADHLLRARALVDAPTLASLAVLAH